MPPIRSKISRCFLIAPIFLYMIQNVLNKLYISGTGKNHPSFLFQLVSIDPGVKSCNNILRIMACSISDCSMWKWMFISALDCHMIGVQWTIQDHRQIEINNVVYFKCTKQLGFFINHDFIN